MKAYILVLFSVACAGCVTAPVTGNKEILFADVLFPAPPVPVTRDDIFALSPAMQDYLARQLAERVLRKGSRLGLLDALRNDIRIEYDSAMTRNAAQAFEARSGNCLSLVIMTAAFARHLGIPVQYQSVYGHEALTRSSGIVFRSTHVNLVLGSRAMDGWLGRDQEHPLVVDFLPPEQVTRLVSRPIPEEMIVAMYLNNRAAEVLAQGDSARAYWLVRAAINTFPAFLAPYNTLGVIYLRHGNLEEAGRTLGYALEREPENTDVLSNLAQVFNRQGRAAEAQVLHDRLAEITPYPPFYFLDQGIAAMERGDTGDAIRLLKKELARMPYAEEVHFAMAVARLRHGEPRLARKHITLALENSTTPGRQDIYAAKLNYLKSLQLTTTK